MLKILNNIFLMSLDAKEGVVEPEEEAFEEYQEEEEGEDEEEEEEGGRRRILNRSLLTL